MGMKMKKAVKTVNPKPAGKSPVRKVTADVVNRETEVQGPGISNLGRSLGTLLDRTRAFIRTSGKAEA